MKLHAPLAHHDQRQTHRRIKFLHIISGCPEGAGKWRILNSMFFHNKNVVQRFNFQRLLTPAVSSAAPAANRTT